MTRAEIHARKLTAERIARVLCSLAGENPDGKQSMILGYRVVSRRNWELWRPQAYVLLSKEGT